ncbi:unannotated protein [freshwater metagenome]|uniref:Unannotated protein n=1 Tax=freshwater metagenome TaxID=449393 RepID=A0A6J5YFZ4_9ZZZZ
MGRNLSLEGDALAGFNNSRLGCSKIGEPGGKECVSDECLRRSNCAKGVLELGERPAPLRGCDVELIDGLRTTFEHCNQCGSFGVEALSKRTQATARGIEFGSGRNLLGTQPGEIDLKFGGPPSEFIAIDPYGFDRIAQYIALAHGSLGTGECLLRRAQVLGELGDRQACVVAERGQEQTQFRVDGLNRRSRFRGDGGGAIQFGRIHCIASCGGCWSRMLGGTAHRTGLLGHKFGRQPGRGIGNETGRQDLLLTRGREKCRCCVLLLDDEFASACGRGETIGGGSDLELMDGELVGNRGEFDKAVVANLEVGVDLPETIGDTRSFGGGGIQRGRNFLQLGARVDHRIECTTLRHHITPGIGDCRDKWFERVMSHDTSRRGCVDDILTSGVSSFGGTVGGESCCA